jgi:hypothetical protein
VREAHDEELYLMRNPPRVSRFRGRGDPCTQ